MTVSFLILRKPILVLILAGFLHAAQGYGFFSGQFFQWRERSYIGPILERIVVPNPESSPESSLEPSAEPSVEPELPPMTMTALINESYMRQVDFIRQGLPMPLVQTFYNHALKKAAKEECILAPDTTISGKCTTPLFEDSDRYALKSLRLLVEQEEANSEKHFPDLIHLSDLPPLEAAEQEKISTTKAETIQLVSQGETKGWEISSFPTDENIRYDPGKNGTCTELAEKMEYYSLTMSASSLTAFVLGMAAQIRLTNGDSPQARMILDNHVKLMYIAARCKRVTGDKLEVPTQQLGLLVRTARLALIAKSLESSEQQSILLPPFEAMKDVIEGSRHFFAEEIERVTSLNSFGKIDYLTWHEDTVSTEPLDSRLASKVSLAAYSQFFTNRNATDPVGPCEQGFAAQLRLGDVKSHGEKCCAETCIIKLGRPRDVFIVNEMCCVACNEILCELSKLARVIAVEAFRFSRSED